MSFVPIAASRELLDDRCRTQDEAHDYHRKTVRLIHEYGVLTFRDRTDRGAFIEAFDELDERSAELWRELLEYGRHIVLDTTDVGLPPIGEVHTVAELRAWAQWVRLVRVQPPDRISGLTFPSQETSFRPFKKDVDGTFATLLEVAKYGIEETKTITNARRSARKTVPMSCTREHVYEVYLFPLFAYCQPRRILIHDRYLGEELRRDGWEREALRWVFEVINATVPARLFPDGREAGAELVVLTTGDAHDRDRDQEMRKAFSELIRDVWSGGVHGIERAKLLVRARYDRDEVIPAIPSNSAHDRCFQLTHSRFGEEPGANWDASPLTTSFFTFSAGVARMGAPIIHQGFEYRVGLVGSWFGDPDDHATLMNLVSHDYNVARTVADLQFSQAG